MIALKEDTSPLSEREEKLLFEAYNGRNREKAQEAMDIITLRNLGLVIRIANSLTHFQLPYEDLVAEGNIGLLKAIDKFDSHRGIRFSTYAVYWIREAMYRANANKASIIRLPVHMGDNIRKIESAEIALSEQNSKAQLSDAQIAAATGICKKAVKRLRSSAIPKVSPGVIDTEHHEQQPLIEQLPATKSCHPDRALMHKESKLFFKQILYSELDEREKLVLNMRIGMDGNKPKSLSFISRQVGLSGEMVRKIQIKSLGKLRKAIENHTDDLTPLIT